MKQIFLKLNLCYAAQTLAKVMAKDEVMLLPAFRGHFEDYIMSGLADCIHISKTPAKIPSTKWIITKLHSYFGEQIVFQCIYRHVGTIINHKNCDLLKAISNIFGQQKKKCNKEKTGQPESLEDDAENSATITSQTITEVAQHLNSKLHEQAKKSITIFKDIDMYTNLHIPTLIDNTDPILLEFIRQLTCTIREGRRRLFDSLGAETSDAKKIRHFYVLCVLLFNANHACSAPLHVLLTETILCHGGDQVLIQVMNRLGAVASLETTKRLATHVVQVRLIKGVKPSLKLNCTNYSISGQRFPYPAPSF